MTGWIQPPRPPLVQLPYEPYLATNEMKAVLLGQMRSAGATIAEIDVASARDERDVIESMRRVLPIPEWCGSTWDSLDDAFSELSENWAFPVVIMLTGYDRQLEQHPHAAINAAIFLTRLSSAFSLIKKQLVLTYFGKQW